MLTESWADRMMGTLAWPHPSPAPSPSATPSIGKAATSFGPATIFAMVVPMRSRSPLRSVAFVIRSPFTKVPFVEPRSSTNHWPSRGTSRACRADAKSSVMTSVESSARPIVI